MPQGNHEILVLQGQRASENIGRFTGVWVFLYRDYCKNPLPHSPLSTSNMKLCSLQAEKPSASYRWPSRPWSQSQEMQRNDPAMGILRG